MTTNPTTEPTPEPTPAITREPTIEPTVEPTVYVKQSGNSDKVLRFDPQDLPTVALITANDRGNFAIVSYIGSDYDDLLVNTIGRYQGTVYVAPGVDSLQITASGPWQIEISALDAATQWDGTTSLNGQGDAVVVGTGTGFGTTTIQNRGTGNFAIIAYDEFGGYLDLLVNEIGNYDGEVLLPTDDPVVLSIQAGDGKWSLSAIH